MVDLKTKLYQMFVLGLDGGGYKNALKQGLGGVIFFTKDIYSEKQFKELIKEIKSQSLVAPFLSIDQEGGRVERTENIHGGKKYLSAKFAYEKGLDFLAKQTQDICIHALGWVRNCTTPLWKMQSDIPLPCKIVSVTCIMKVSE